MNHRSNRGFIDIWIPRPIQWLMVAALIIGLLTIVGGTIYAIYWLITHVRFI